MAQVGDCLKHPKLPIFVVCSESHFTILFSRLLPDAFAALEVACVQDPSDNIDLFYYDGLANQPNEIILSVCTKVLCI
jgi:hypothetical protein